jgi:hypothetical protein
VEFCKKKEKNCLTPYLRCAEVGDAYTYLGFKKKTQFFIGFVVGKWNEETCKEFYKLLASRLRLPTIKRKLTLISDGNEQNIGGIQEAFPQGTVHYARRKKIRKGQKIVGIVSEKVFGNADWKDIAINQIDGFCSKLRERISCYTRKARSFAKQKICIMQRLEIFSVQHNFMEKKYGKTPAMREGITDKKWTWEWFFNQRLTT